MELGFEKGLIILGVAFFFSFLFVKILQPIATWLHLVDRPGGRKRHSGVIPLVGGVAIYLSVFLTALIFLDQPIFIRFFLLAGGLIVFMGMLDDRYELSARLRLAGQVLIASIFVYGLDVHIESFGNIFGLGEIKPGIWGYPLTVLSLVGVINAFNMLDGMDGLVGSIVSVGMIGLVGLFGVSGHPNLQLLCMIFIGAISAFLIFNIWGGVEKPRLGKVFMGDSGSMFLGLSLGVLVIYGSQEPVSSFSPVTALWIVLLPMTDMFTIMYRRLKRGKSPLEPDRTHIHHILIRSGFSKKQTLNIMVGVQGLFVALGVVLLQQNMPESLSFCFIAALVICYQIMMARCWRLMRWTRRHLLGNL